MRILRIVLILAACGALALTFSVIARSSPPPEAAEAAGARSELDNVAERAAGLLARYIAIDTTNPPGNEIEGANFLAGILEAEGIEARVFESEPRRGSLYARLPGTGTKKAVLLLSHIDVVPVDRDEWSHDPYAGSVVGGSLFGRGALDSKGVGIVELLAMIALKRSGRPLDRDVVLMATADEETGGRLGAGWMIENHFDLVRDVEFVLNEGGFIHHSDNMPLIFNINAAEKAPCWFRITASGDPGHASRAPEQTAVTRLVEALGALIAWERPLEVGPVVAGYYSAYAAIDEQHAREFRDLDRALESPEFRRWFLSDPGAAALVRDTLTPTVLEGSSKTNVVPATAVAEVDSRLLPGHDCDDFLAEVRRRIAGPNVVVEPTGTAFPSSQSPIDNELTASVERVAAEESQPSVVLPGLLAGFTDSHWFRERGIDAYGFVPIEVTAEQRAAIHGPNENVEVVALERGVKRLVALLRELDR